MRFLFVVTIILTSTVCIFCAREQNVIVNKLSPRTPKLYRYLKDIDITNDNLVEDSYYDLSVNSSDVCQSTTCESFGKTLKSNINATVDPCDDFYEFACGGWLELHTIPEDKSRYFGDDGLQDVIELSIKESLSQSSQNSSSESITYASDLYKSCIDNATRESRGVSPLISAINSIGGWPTIGSAVYNETTYDWKESYAQLMALYGIRPVFFIYVISDANDTKVNRFNYDSPGFGLGRSHLLSLFADSPELKAYKNYILKVALLLGAKDDSQTHKDIEDLIGFENRLANFSLPSEDRRDSSVWYNRITFEKLNTLTENRVDWLNLTNRIYSKLNSTIRVKSDELLILNDIDYYKEVVKYLEKVPKRVIANYFAFALASSFGSLTNSAFRSADFEFNQITSGVQKDVELWRYCVSDISSIFDYAVSRLYVEKSFSPKAKQESLDIVNDIKESYNELIKESDWLDEITKNQSLIKLNSIQLNVGYPDWILTDQELDKFYNLKQKVDGKKFFESIVYSLFIFNIKEFNSLREPVNKDQDWPMAPHIVNAAYDPTQNSITIPAGQLTPPYFDLQLPAYINYGSIGAVIGHELTHGFDDEGSQFDANGNLVDWWTEKTFEQFDDRAQCFIDEYENIVDTQAKIHLNGENTVGENIADNGGIREAYRAYESYVKKNGKQQRLPHVDEYTPEQEFFISYANSWCTKYRTEYLKDLIRNNAHSPAKYRVNVVLSNDQTFSDVYKCNANSRMNIKDKCVLW